ncbi:uroporphyrinogen-III synthase [Elasticomyces elasticus]|nr:uroporphyrinogen-III synthase [Elasticomyces elasticus]
MEDVTSGLAGLTIDQIPVYLLKTKSSPVDTYEEHFDSLSNAKYKPIFVPVLEHMFRDDALRSLRRSAERFAFAGGSEANDAYLRRATNNPAKKYGGLIFTSQRAVDAFGYVVSKLDPSKLGALFDKDMPLSLGLPCPVLGEETGNGEALAEFILDHRKSLSQDVTQLDNQTLPLLFMVGEQRRDIIPNTLQSDGLSAEERTPVTELVVYETGEAATFEESFTRLLREAKAKGVKKQWVVVFSPQGCEAMLNALGWLEATGKYSEARKQAVMGLLKSHIVTIGPTTRDFLLQEFGYEPDVCAAKPSPEGVAEAIVAYEAS